jgi:plasmid stability protein
MATLNVKNFPDTLYDKLQAKARQDRRSLAQEVTVLLAAALDVPEPLSIMALEGLGREVWRGIDAPTHVEAERTAWD